MRISTLLVGCVWMSASLAFGMSIIPSQSEWYGSGHYPHYPKKVETVPVIYKKVDSVLPVILALILSQFFTSSSSNVTDTATLAANGITVVTSNPCCG